MLRKASSCLSASATCSTGQVFLLCFTYDDTPAWEMPQGSGVGAKPPMCADAGHIHVAPARSVLLAGGIRSLDPGAGLTWQHCSGGFGRQRWRQRKSGPQPILIWEAGIWKQITEAWISQMKCGRKGQYFIHVGRSGRAVDELLFLPPHGKRPDQTAVWVRISHLATFDELSRH